MAKKETLIYMVLHYVFTSWRWLEWLAFMESLFNCVW